VTDDITNGVTDGVSVDVANGETVVVIVIVTGLTGASLSEVIASDSDIGTVAIEDMTGVFIKLRKMTVDVTVTVSVLIM
jgi:hypothetical protein